MAINQVVILAAGNSSRFSPFADHSHKSQFEIMGKSIIEWTLHSLAELRLTEVIVVTGENPELQQLLSQLELPFSLKVITQPSAQGMGNAILCAQEFLHDTFLVVGPHHINAGSIISKTALLQADTVTLCCKPTNTPQHYGIVTVHNNQATGLMEKPKVSVENPHRIVGIYSLTKDFVSSMASMSEEEYLLETALHQWIQQHAVPVYQVTEPTLTLKYPWDVFEIKNYLLENTTRTISPTASIAPTAIITGIVVIEDEAVISDYAIINGPTYIGKKAIVGQHCVVRKGSILESEAELQRFCDVSNSIIMAGTHIHSGFVGDSIIGKNCRMGAGFITANRRFDRAEIGVRVKGEKVNSCRNALGVLIGNEVKIGIQSGTMPGIIIGAKALIGPGIIVNKDVPAETQLWES